MLRNYAPQTGFVAEFCNFQFTLSDLPAIAETSFNSRKKQEITVSEEKVILASGCSMTDFKNNLREKLGLTERNARKVISDYLESGKLIKFEKPGTRLTWICEPEAQVTWFKLWSGKDAA